MKICQLHYSAHSNLLLCFIANKKKELEMIEYNTILELFITVSLNDNNTNATELMGKLTNAVQTVTATHDPTSSTKKRPLVLPLPLT